MGRRIVVLFLVETYTKKGGQLRLTDVFATIHDINARRLIASASDSNGAELFGCA